MPELSVTFTSPTSLVGSFESVVVLINKTTAQVDAIEKGIAHAQAVAKRYPEGIGVMCVMMPGTTPPDAAGRQKINTWMHAYAPKYLKLGFSLVIRSDTVWGGVMRMVARAIALSNRAIIKDEIFENTTQAAAFHARLSNGRLRASDLDAAVTRACQRFEAPEQRTPQQA